jgi:hypothetical protein
MIEYSIFLNSLSSIEPDMKREIYKLFVSFKEYMNQEIDIRIKHQLELI